MSRTIVALWVMGLLALAAQPDWYYAKLDTNPRLPTNKLFYLEQKAGLWPKPTDEESLNVRLVGKWGGGPSWGVTGKDTLVYLSRGSEVVVINFADTARPKILNYIQAKRLAGRPVLVDTLLYLATSGYIEVFNVKDPTNAPRVGRLATPVNDIDVEDTLLYSISDDTFRVFDFADPANPHLVGACADSGYAMDFDGGYAYLRDRWGMYILDVRDPTNPHRVATWGTDIAGVKVRGHHCYVAQGSAGSGNLYVLNVSNPASPWQEGVLSGVADDDIYLVDTLLFMPGFRVVSIADSSRPRLIGQATVGGLTVWVDNELRQGYVDKDQYGMTVLSLSDIAHPATDTELLAMGDGSGISVRNGIACVASLGGTGLTLLDLSDPTHIRELANLDTAGGGPSSGAVVNCDSLVYIGWGAGASNEFLRVVDITNPVYPHFVGGGNGFNPVEAMVKRDSLVYCAEDYKFEVFSVANPRQPAWRGNCDLSTFQGGVAVQDTFAYVAPNLQIIDIARPSQPTPVSSTPCGAWDIALRDTFAFVAHSDESLKVYSMANVYGPRELNSVWVPGQAYAVALRDSYAYLGCDDFRVFNVTSPASPMLAGCYSTPRIVRGLDFDGQYIYAACSMAGVEVLELLPASVSEPKQSEAEQARKGASVVRGVMNLEIGSRQNTAYRAELLDVSGRKVLDLHPGANDVRALAPGVYFVREAQARAQAQSVRKVIKLK